MNVEIKRLKPNAVIPQYATPGAAGLDLVACIDEPIALWPGETFMVPTGIAINIKDPGIACQIIPRSGLGVKHGVVIANLVGLCDSDYQGEYFACLWNRNVKGQPSYEFKPFMINPGDRIAQAIFIRVEQVTFTEVESFVEVTERGEGGFGSTGMATENETQTTTENQNETGA